MMQTQTGRARVEVAVAAVVENMSSLDVLRPAPTSLKALRAAGRSDARVLITLRGTARVLGGLWELPGGKIEANETVEQAVVRELREEVGITVEPIHELDAVEHVYDHAHIRLLPCICRRVDGLPRALEVDEVRWVALDDLDDYCFPEASGPVLEALRRLLVA